MRSKEIIDKIFIRGLQNFAKYDSLNPIEIKIEWNKILANLHKYEKGNYKYRSLVSGVLFSSRTKNYANTLFITCNGLKNTHDSIINRKVYKLLGVMSLEQIKNWKKLKGVSNWVNAILTDLNEPLNSDHFAFGFETKTSNDLLNF